MDKDSSIVTKLINNEEFVSKAERVAEALEVFEKNKSQIELMMHFFHF
jgi:hypothetical protein